MVSRRHFLRALGAVGVCLAAQGWWPQQKETSYRLKPEYTGVLTAEHMQKLYDWAETNMLPPYHCRRCGRSYYVWLPPGWPTGQNKALLSGGPGTFVALSEAARCPRCNGRIVRP